MKKLFEKIQNKDYLILQVLGSCGIVVATYLWSLIAAIYMASVIVLIWGIVVELARESKTKVAGKDGNR